jgi:Cu(I)/Ag(I) efflux system membrane fusion protein
VFERVSEALIGLVASKGNPLPYLVRRVRCPMAFEGRGGRWLQRAEKVANPYYGSQMMACGTVESAIAPGAKG